MDFKSCRRTDNKPVSKTYYNIEDSFDDISGDDASLKEVSYENSETPIHVPYSKMAINQPSVMDSSKSSGHVSRRSSRRNSDRSKQMEVARDGVGGSTSQARPRSKYSHGPRSRKSAGNGRSLHDNKAFGEGSSRRRAVKDYLDCGSQKVIPDGSRSARCKSTQTAITMHGSVGSSPFGEQKSDISQRFSGSRCISNDQCGESSVLSRDGVVSEQTILYTGESFKRTEARVQGNCLDNASSMLLVKSPPIYIPRPKLYRNEMEGPTD